MYAQSNIGQVQPTFLWVVIMKTLKYKTYQAATTNNNPEGKYELTWEDLRQETIAKFNNDVMIDVDDIITTLEDYQEREIRPRMDNSRTWYKERIFTLRVYYKR